MQESTQFSQQQPPTSDNLESRQDLTLIGNKLRTLHPQDGDIDHVINALELQFEHIIDLQHQNNLLEQRYSNLKNEQSLVQLQKQMGIGMKKAMDQLKESQAETMALRDAKHKLEMALRRLQSDNSTKQQQIDDVQSQCMKLTRQIQDMKNDQSSTLGSQGRVGDDVVVRALLEQKKPDARKAQKTSHSSEEGDQHETVIYSLQTQLRETENQLKQIKSLAFQYQTENDRSMHLSVQQKKEIQQLKQTLHAKNQFIKLLQSQIAEISSHITETERYELAVIERYKLQLDDMKAKYEELSTQLQQIQDELGQSEAERRVLEQKMQAFKNTQPDASLGSMSIKSALAQGKAPEQYQQQLQQQYSQKFKRLLDDFENLRQDWKRLDEGQPSLYRWDQYVTNL
ncbi:hypothetical protein MIR68_001087 [Amoeboaphelidium protococcarum]|nr:hypothetical protein MIR68_001087 [Amoeboaphelidium protococcarum]